MIKVIYSYGVNPSWQRKFENELRMVEKGSAGKYEITTCKQLGWKNGPYPGAERDRIRINR